MKHLLFATITLCYLLLHSCTPMPKAEDERLFYKAPAEQWEETLPIGNGRLGMMPDGGIDSEKIVLNEISMWSGSVADYRNEEAANCLPIIQELLFEGKNKEAQELMYKSFVPKKPEKGGTYGFYQMLADLNIDYLYNNSNSIKNYERGLNLSTSVAYTELTRGEQRYERKYFASRDKDVLVVKLTSNTPNNINIKVDMTRPTFDGSIHQASVAPNGILELTGVLDSGKEGVNGIAYAACADIKVVGKKALKTIEHNYVTIENAEEVWIVISAATSFFENDNYLQRAHELLAAAVSNDLDVVEKESIKSYQSLYNRAGIKIDGNPEMMNVPTDERILRFQQEEDPSLAALYYNYGRYLLISSTRPGSLPPNLQGLWANEIQTPWNGDYHTSINVQMNHWPVEQGNLSELHLPLVELTKGLVGSGQETAKAFYGENAKGWVAHMMTNVWQYTAPGEHPSWGATNTGGAWLCAHLWEHYLFTQDKAYLEDIYPTLKGASEFFLSTMVEEPKNGWLVTAPTSSPENTFYVGADRTPISVCMGPTMDTQLVRELYGNVIEASKTLNIDQEYSEQLATALTKLPPNQISEEGYLMEWLEDYEEAEPQHRHVSHLYGLHPSNQISTTLTPELAEACKETLERRGDGGTGWSRAWKINFWARLGDGNRAYSLFKSLMVPAYTPENPKQHGSGTFPNLFCSHPPFQIDGNWGGTAGIGEMLLQSQDGFINFLPALPDAWLSGSFYGLKVRGGATVSLAWENGKPSNATIKAENPGVYKFKNPTANGIIKITTKGKTTETSEEFFEVSLGKGETATISFI